MRNDIITDELVAALRDYSYLLNRRYPRKSVLKLVGDRYMLNTFQRILLSRGIFTEEEVQGRNGKMERRIDGKEIFIDGYNILFTVCNYLLGRMVFIGNDHFIRDAGEVYNKPVEDPVFGKAISLTVNTLSKLKPSRVEFIFDRPVSHSAELAGSIRELLSKAGMEGDARIDKNPDAVLIRQDSGMVASSDSDILDNTELPVVDLARLILEVNYRLELPDLGKLMA